MPLIIIMIVIITISRRKNKKMNSNWQLLRVSQF
ncbi:hypothetical protein MEM_04570 [Candida albicans L26]|nr:hypothetical protein MEU_04598 [Candida albicans P37005]KGT65984.1 hypothetical protein MEK_04597 [Candida albicans 12C]KGU05407.1 hypothetical protein MEY_04578 [Candida albicans 19F]KGU05881.1 hypothetical protein MEM_04570 [Candida albicans L26]KHC50287.1 hypothetical protein MGC_04591 [Candida albicans P37039]KHC73262.1 hypothetical protein W5Q_04699 [Candida albicans SC5314]